MISITLSLPLEDSKGQAPSSDYPSELLEEEFKSALTAYFHIHSLDQKTLKGTELLIDNQASSASERSGSLFLK